MTENPCQQSRSEPISDLPIWYHERAQNGPNRSAGTRRPGPDLSTSLDMTEEY